MGYPEPASASYTGFYPESRTDQTKPHAFLGAVERVRAVLPADHVVGEGTVLDLETILIAAS